MAGEKSHSRRDWDITLIGLLELVKAARHWPGSEKPRKRSRGATPGSSTSWVRWLFWRKAA
jgi:hypothetical protein